MLIRIFVLTYFFCFVVTEPSQYVILRVKDPKNFEPTSAQFTLRQPQGQPEVAWVCKDGPNPIAYMYNKSLKGRAKSIDVEVGGSVECLNMKVSVVVGHMTPVWQGDELQCPGLKKKAYKLEWKVDSRSEYFEFQPAIQFEVYDREPTATCAAREYLSVDKPRIHLDHQGGILRSCSVLSQQRNLLTCNIQVSAGVDIIASADDKHEISVPGFFWKTNIKVVTCRCECRIKSLENGTLEQAVANYSRSRGDSGEYSINVQNDDNPSFYASNTPSRSTSVSDEKLLAVILALGILLVMMVIVAIFFFVMTRDLKKRLQKTRQGSISAEECSFKNQASLPSYLSRQATAPPGGRLEPGLYSRLHCSHNDCRFYNHTNLKLPDFNINPPYEKPPRPVYQHISYKEEFP